MSVLICGSAGNLPAIPCTRVSVWGWSFILGVSLDQWHLPGGVTMGHADAITAVLRPYCPHMLIPFAFPPLSHTVHTQTV